MSTNPQPHLFWITSRAAGTAALVLASVSVALGLLMSTRLMRGRGPDLRVAHEALSLSAIAAIVIHGVALLGDHYLHPSVADIGVPFVSGYKTWWTSLGIVAGWATVALGFSFYLRRWIGQDRWRRLHRLTALAWVMGVAHSLGEGTDAGQIWFMTMTAIVALPASLLLIGRIGGVGRRRPAERVAAAAHVRS
jgi:methionine sulfoxide reductase heme-binding subunit